MLRYFFTNETTAPVGDLIASVLQEMQTKGVNSDEYPKLLSYLERLHELKEKGNPTPVSRDTMILVFGNLMGILLIVAYEQKHVMTSKGFSQIIRPRGA